MLTISKEDIANNFMRSNTWWRTAGELIVEQGYPKRDYFTAFHHLVTQSKIRRAVVLMGPRRVGKTVIVKQSIASLLSAGVTPASIFYASLDTPTLVGQPLEKLLTIYLETFANASEQSFVFFDEVQYLKDWEVHLKALVDAYPSVKFIVTGSAAAVLRRKSEESGAGRFTDFMLPPLTFAEFLRFTDRLRTAPIADINSAFVEYLSYGGYPEIVRNPVLQKMKDQYLRNDIIDKVLNRDLPSLYGVTDLQEMHRLFATLVYNTGQEISLSKLSQNSGVSKETLKRYISFFEGAFLIKRLSRVDDTARDFKRERTFKVYVSNPTLHSALFGSLEPDDPKMGAVVETAVFAQAMNGFPDSLFRYARWKRGTNEGEVDLVVIDRSRFRPTGAMEIKWSNRIARDVTVASNLARFVSDNITSQPRAWVTTRDYQGSFALGGVHIECVPSAEACLRYAEQGIASLEEKLGVDAQPSLDL